MPRTPLGSSSSTEGRLSPEKRHWVHDDSGIDKFDVRRLPFLYTLTYFLYNGGFHRWLWPHWCHICATAGGRGIQCEFNLMSSLRCRYSHSFRCESGCYGRARRPVCHRQFHWQQLAERRRETRVPGAHKKNSVEYQKDMNRFVPYSFSY